MKITRNPTADSRLDYQGGHLNVSEMRLASLEGSPQKVSGNFNCHSNLLTTLKGAPEIVDGRFCCHFNELTSLEGAPKEVGGDVCCGSNKLASLKGIHRNIKKIGGDFNAAGNPIGSHVLGLLLIEGLKAVDFDNEAVKTILNKHLPSQGMRSVLLCQEELLDAGFDEFAQL